MKAFGERRKIINALRLFRPELASEREEYPPIELLLVAFLTLVGTATILFYLGVGLMQLYQILNNTAQ